MFGSGTDPAATAPVQLVAVQPADAVALQSHTGPVAGPELVAVAAHPTAPGDVPAPPHTLPADAWPLWSRNR